MKSIVRIEPLANLRLLASVGHEVNVSITGPVTQRAILDALEATYPMLQGTIRDNTSKLRCPFIRFFASERDLSQVSPDDSLPDSIVRGLERFLIIGAIAGG